MTLLNNLAMGNTHHLQWGHKGMYYWFGSLLLTMQYALEFIIYHDIPSFVVPNYQDCSVRISYFFCSYIKIIKKRTAGQKEQKSKDQRLSNAMTNYQQFKKQRHRIPTICSAPFASKKSFLHFIGYHPSQSHRVLLSLPLPLQRRLSLQDVSNRNDLLLMYSDRDGIGDSSYLSSQLRLLPPSFFAEHIPSFSLASWPSWSSIEPEGHW